jgi:putative DNA primase/helicase
VTNEFEVYQRIISRWDVWAQQNTKADTKGRYGYFTKKLKLTENDIYDSILGEKKTIGAYIVNPVNNTCTNPQIDVDNHDNNVNVNDSVLKIVNELKRIGLNPYIEASGGELSQGAHIGLICKPTSAKTCKTVLDTVLKTLDLKGHEVFPKQTEVNPDSFGNLVKLPFQFNNRTKARSQIINPETMQPFEKQDAINYLMALPDSVFSVDALNEGKIPPIKTGAYFYDVFKIENIKPCIVKAYDEKLNLHGKGDAGHEFHLAIAGDMIYNGATNEQVHDYFKIQSDYSRETSENQIKSVENYIATGKKPMGCKKIIENCSVFLNGLCESCKNKPKEKKKKSTSDHLNEIKQLPYTDLGNAKRFVEFHRGNLRYVPVWKTWMIYDGKRWIEKDNSGIVPCVDQVLQNMHVEAGKMDRNSDGAELLDHAEKSESEHHIMAMIRLAQGLPGVAIDPDDFDKDKYLINVINGTVDLRTGTFREFRREDMITQVANVTYDNNATAPIWAGFLKRIMQDDESMITFLQRAAGYALTGDSSEECIFMLYGTGANGKSKFIDALAFMMGEYARKTAIHTVMEMKNESALSSDIAALKGVRFAYASEPNKGKRLDEGKIKDVTGREKISCCRKFCEPEEYQPQFKLFISFNHKPVIKSVDEGLHRRIRFIPFSVKIPDAEKDKDLDRKLHAEAPGILNWALQGVKAWQENGIGFPDKAKAATETYFDEMDSLGEFLETCCVIGKECSVSFQLLYNLFLKWCEYKHIYKLSDKAFSQALNERDIISEKAKGVRIKRGCQMNANLTSVHLSIDNGLLDISYLDALDRLFSHSPPLSTTVTCNNNVSNVSNASNGNGNGIISQSVQSVQSVQEKIRDILKKEYEKIPKPNSFIHLEKLKDQMEVHIMSNLDPEIDENNENKDDNYTIKTLISNFCKSRGWE